MTPKEQLLKIAKLASEEPWWQITRVETKLAVKYRCSLIHKNKHYTSGDQESENLAISVALHNYLKGVESV